MSRETDEELSKFLFLNSVQIEQEVRLNLYSPRMNNRKLTTADLFDLQQKYPLIKRFNLEEGFIDGEDRAILCFESIEDALDFQQEEKQNLTYSMAMISSAENQIVKEGIKQMYSPSKIEKEMDEEGFYLANGEVKMKKITSVEFLIDEDEKGIWDNESTFVHTQRKISIDEKLQPEIEQISGHLYIQTLNVEKQVVKQETSLKPLVDGIILTSILYGGFKLIRYFAQF